MGKRYSTHMRDNYTVEVSNSTRSRSELVTVHDCRNWQAALDAALNGRWWASRGVVKYRNGKPFGEERLLSKLF